MTKSMQKIKMFPAAAAACVLPMFFALAGLFIVPNYPFDIVVIKPILIGVLFGSPFAAWLACRFLRGVQSSSVTYRWRSCCRAGVVAATITQLMGGLFYTCLLAIAFVADTHRISDFFMVLHYSVLIQACLWLLGTLPVALSCGSIFWAVTKLSAKKLTP